MQTSPPAKFDISALGRQLFIDPEYPKKVMEGRLGDIKRCTRCGTCLARCLSLLPPACPFNPVLGREYGMPEYQIGPRQKHESIIPKGLTNAPIPALDRPWWTKEVPVIEKSYRKFRGPGPQR